MTALRPFDDVDLHAFVDNQLGPNRRESVAAYLRFESDDSARVTKWQRQTEAIRDTFAAVATEPVPLWLTVGQIDADRNKAPAPRAPSAKEIESIGSSPGEISRRPLFYAALAVALAFGAGMAVPHVAARWPLASHFWLVDAAPSPQEAFRQRALDAHNTFGTDAERPVEVADVPQGTLKRWLERRVPFAASVPDLRNQGWTLRGGRVAPAEHGPGALIVYDNGLGDRLSLFEARLDGPAGDETATGPSADGVLSWVQGAVGYAVVTSRSPGWLARNQHQLYTAIRGVTTPD